LLIPDVLSAKEVPMVIAIRLTILPSKARAPPKVPDNENELLAEYNNIQEKAITNHPETIPKRFEAP
jgi:hypothetical protein